jgi:hypothetical protein
LDGDDAVVVVAAALVALAMNSSSRPWFPVAISISNSKSEFAGM